METKEIFSLSISAIALGVSIASVYWNRRQWRVVNRPFVVVRLINPKAGNRGTCYELQVVNIGQRPAIGVKLRTNAEALRRAIDPTSAFPPDDVEACFADSTIIGLLTPGESVTSAFGFNGSKPGEQLWKMGSILPVAITYRDLEHREFTTKGSLTIATRNGFTGYTWSDS